jgi:RHS repeat-associated protein
VVTKSTGQQPVLGFDGQLEDPRGSGLVYLRNRWYDPATAQFLTPDPLSAVSGQAYLYASDNPLSYNDDSGLLLGIPDTPSFGEVGSALGGFAVEHYGQIAEGVAGGICIATVVAAPECIGATLIGVTASTVQNATSPEGFSPAGEATDILGTLPGLQVAGADAAGMLAPGVGKVAANTLATLVGSGTIVVDPVIVAAEKNKDGGSGSGSGSKSGGGSNSGGGSGGGSTPGGGSGTHPKSPCP